MFPSSIYLENNENKLVLSYSIRVFTFLFVILTFIVSFLSFLLAYNIDVIRFIIRLFI